MKTTKYETVVLVDGVLWNIGKWDYQEYQEEVVGNPFPRPMAEPPPGWDFQITYRTVQGNPLPPGAVFAEEEVFYDRQGAATLVSQAGAAEAETVQEQRLAEYRELMEKLTLQIATEEERQRAIELRYLIK